MSSRLRRGTSPACRGLIGAVLAFAIANGMPAAQASAAEGCTTGQTASVVPVHVRAPAEMLDLRVADTITKRASGLMCVRSLPARSGMIFVFNDGDNLRDFWMKNTLIPLDMVFVAKNGRVNDVRANVPATKVDTPEDKIPTASGTGSYVIELPAGEAARAGIKPGTNVDVSAVPPGKE